MLVSIRSSRGTNNGHPLKNDEVEQAASPYTDEMMSSMISGLHIKYYAHLNNNYCKKQEVLEYRRKHATQECPEGDLFKVHDSL
jgi:hypothetical protein